MGNPKAARDVHEQQPATGKRGANGWAGILAYFFLRPTASPVRRLRHDGDNPGAATFPTGAKHLMVSMHAVSARNGDLPFEDCTASQTTGRASWIVPQRSWMKLPGLPRVGYGLAGGAVRTKAALCRRMHGVLARVPRRSRREMRRTLWAHATPVQQIQDLSD